MSPEQDPIGDKLKAAIKLADENIARADRILKSIEGSK
jgi:hypothetical protein